MLENSLHASVDVISREIRFMSVNPGFVEFDGSFQIMLFHIPKLISGVDISSKSAEVVYGLDPDKPETSYRAPMTLWILDGDNCVFRWTIPFAFFAEKRWVFFQVRIRTTSGTTVENQWSTKLKKVHVTPGLTGGQEAYTQVQQDAIAALNSRVTALEASEGGSGGIQLQVDSTPTKNSPNLVTSGGVYDAIQNAGEGGSGGSVSWTDVSESVTLTANSGASSIRNAAFYYCAALGLVMFSYRFYASSGVTSASIYQDGYVPNNSRVTAMAVDDSDYAVTGAFHNVGFQDGDNYTWRNLHSFSVHDSAANIDEGHQIYASGWYFCDGA